MISTFLLASDAIELTSTNRAMAESKKTKRRIRYRIPEAAIDACKELPPHSECQYQLANYNYNGKCYQADESRKTYCLPNNIAPPHIDKIPKKEKAPDEFKELK